MARQQLQNIALNETTADRVRRHIRDEIISGNLLAGDRLLQDELAEKLGVSRIPIREGLAHLEAEGFVLVEPHQGAVVAPLSVMDGREIFELRALLESRLLKIAITKMTDADFAWADKMLVQLNQAETQDPSLLKWGMLNWEFHAAFYHPAEQPRTLAVVKSLHQHSERYLQLQMRMQARTRRADEQHRMLIQLCRARKTGEAVAFLREHILNILPDLGLLELPAEKPRRTRNAHSTAPRG
jgi:DNA-binding GntR family transcriptional regulator